MSRDDKQEMKTLPLVSVVLTANDSVMCFCRGVQWT
jgi:hypothetical protein